VVEAVTRDGLPVEEAAAMLASRSAKPEWYGPRGGTEGPEGSREPARERGDRGHRA
jgi:hypothetical protein